MVFNSVLDYLLGTGTNRLLDFNQISQIYHRSVKGKLS